MPPLTLGRARPMLLDAVVLGTLVLSGLVPAPVLLLSLAVPLCLVMTFATLDAFFSMSLPGRDTTAQDLASRLLGLLAYALLAASAYLAVTSRPDPVAWAGLGVALVFVLGRMWRDSARHGALFPHGYTPALLECVAVAAGIATYVLIDQGRAVLPAVVTIGLRTVAELWWEWSHPPDHAWADAPPRPSGTPPYWGRGTRIVWRYGEPDAPHFAATLTVVRDDADGLVAWLARGTPMLVVARADGRPGRSEPATMFTAERVQAEGHWHGYDVLRVAPTGRAWSVWVFFTPEGEHVGWYVNLEDPHRRDADTVHSSDHVLDLWVEPDRTRERKDEDELALAVEQGRYTEAEARRIDLTAIEVEAVIDAWGPPFCDRWEDFRPSPGWAVPAVAPPVP